MSVKTILCAILCFIVMSLSAFAAEGDGDVNDARYQLEDASEGDRIIISNLREFVRSNPGFLEGADISYSTVAYSTMQEPKEIGINDIPEDTLIIYKTMGVFHSYQLSNDGSMEMLDTDRIVSDFAEHIDAIFSDASLYSDSGTVIVDSFSRTRSYFGTYEEAGQQVSGRKGKTDDTFIIYRSADVDPDHDYYLVRRITTVYPYLSKSASVITSYYSSGVAPYAPGGAKLLSAFPLTNKLSANHGSPIPISAGNPWSAGLRFNWIEGTGTKMVSKIDSNGMHELGFSNSTGLYSPAVDYPEGEFYYVSFTEYKVQESARFGFQYNNYFVNLSYGNGLVPHYHGGEWYVIQV